MNETKADALATLRTMIVSAFAATAQHTGLHAGPATDALADEIMKQITDPSVAWTFAVLAKKGRR